MPITKKAFTLAEVLIVLGIIGVIAALTIPSLIQKTQDAEFINKMKKEYSVLSQAQLQIASDYSGNFESATVSCGSDFNNCFKNLFLAKIKYSLDCPSNAPGVCYPNISVMKYLNGNAVNLTDGNGTTVYTSAGAILNDGTSVIFIINNPSCSDTLSPYNDKCGQITIDVNGLQGPNTFGRDIYCFWVFANAIRPSQWPGTIIVPTDDCGVGTNHGQTCASKYLYSK